MYMIYVNYPILYQMSQRTNRYPDAIINNIFYYFSAYHIFNVIINDKSYDLPVLHTIIYDYDSNKNDMYLAIPDNIQTSKSEILEDLDLNLEEHGEIFKLKNIEFSLETFRKYQWEIISILISNNQLLNMYKNNEKYEFVFRINFKQKKYLLIIKNDQFILQELDYFNASIEYIVEHKPHTCSRVISKDEIEYIFYYTKPHKPSNCFKYTEKIQKEYYEIKSKNNKDNQNKITIYNWQFDLQKIDYLFLIYRIKNGNLLTKIYIEYNDCDKKSKNN